MALVDRRDDDGATMEQDGARALSIERISFVTSRQSFRGIEQ